MSIHVALHHKTAYRYDKPTQHYPHLIRLRPAPHCRTKILSYSLKVSDEEHFLNWQQDPFGNYMGRCVFPERLKELEVEVNLVAEMSILNPFDFFLEEAFEEFPFTYEPWLKKELAPYMKKGRMTKRLRSYIESISTEPCHTTNFLVALNQRLSNDIKYLIRMEPGVQTPHETLRLGSGSCRDTAWLLVTILRRLGLAARFASGYLIQLKPDVKALDGPSGTEVDFTDLHAWCEVFLPGAGWIGFDPTSGLLAGEGHIPLACTPEPSSAAPVTGSTEKCEVEFDHEMSVQRIHESPRVTLPYSDDQWEAINALGHKVDERLKADDVRLTMGGEPTFVSIDDMEGEEWNYTAMSDKKLSLSRELMWKLRDQMGPGALLHHGQGKWYPGESLPRWALGCFWRKDGEPVWKDDSLIAWDDLDREYSDEDAGTFVRQLADNLDVSAETVVPAHEDTWYYLWKERRLPDNVNPLDSKLDDKEERARLAKVFEQGLDKVIGYVLPLKREEKKECWTTGKWVLRKENLYLIPGDSPIGYRLPMDSLPHLPAKERQQIYPQDPVSQFDSLPAHAELMQRANPRGVSHNPALSSAPEVPLKQQFPSMKEKGEAAKKVAEAKSAGAVDDKRVRTALCVEPRDGKLHVFMPPLSKASDYLELVSMIEKTAADTGMPVILEGETPPHDPGIEVLKVTPDPGVIEVNVPPVNNWEEMVTQTNTVYEEARLSRLGTEKFMLDGRHTGTGGGNHITMGGTTPADSPFLRRPDLLRSLVNYWQNHPSLSFVFSGLFIGPSSQHPRVDEARNDSLYELEIAARQVADQSEVPPWLVDRLYRNLLVDGTGNTHRAEFCIDKLYSPDSSSGRLGLLEMRAFEMPPHARMSLTQQLLLRSIVARLWNEPYDQPLARWQTQIHDRFMLHHFNRQDLQDVVEDLQSHDLPMQLDWFEPHLEFRFPTCGELEHRGMHMELRQALEPWHVLGEQGAIGGTSRSVDSSLERVQVKVKGITDSRHVVTCNGRRVPLHPTGVQGEAVAGIRFRAWQPPECLHPNIGVHVPLVLDVMDSWNGRSVAGCRYDVSDPAGRNHEVFPVNSYEAESRRLARFSELRNTPGKISVPPVEKNHDFPMTLDLRRDNDVQGRS